MLFKRRKQRKQEELPTNIGSSLEAVQGLAEFISVLDKSLEDKKIQFTEWPPLAASGVQLAKSLRKWNEIKLEFSDLDAQEAEILVMNFQKEFDLSNDIAEEVVEALADILLSISFIRQKVNDSKK